MIGVETGAAQHLAAPGFATIFATFWGYPLFWADTREAALASAEAPLAADAMPAAAH